MKNPKFQNILNRPFLYLSLFFILIIGFSYPSEFPNSSNSITHTYPLTDGPDKNPMKGWNSGWWNDHDFTSIGFQYIGWKDFEPQNGVFNYQAVEDVINRPGTQGRHLILRLYCDWAGDNATSDAGPSWLFSDLGVDRLDNGSGRFVTDFNNQNYIDAAIEAIDSLSVKYDNDPRIFGIQIGILGYWGEWHTAGFGNGFSLTDATRSQILDTTRTKYSNARVMGRYPWNNILAGAGDIGFYNDFFGPVPHSYDFDDEILANLMWLEGPIGGEMPPEISQAELDILYSTPEGLNILNNGHYTSMQPKDGSPCDADPNSSNCQGFIDMHKKMGYNFQIENAIFPELISQNENLSIQLNGNNIGVAPMYYDWDVQFALLNTNNEIVKQFDVIYNLTSILDGASFSLSTLSAIDDVTVGDYRIGIRLIQPDADLPKVDTWELDTRNVYILFSNELPVVDGSWNPDNSLDGGWNVLGDLEIEASSANNHDARVLIFHKTNGFRHSNAINKGITLIENLGDANGWETDNTQDANYFNADTLANYDLVIFHNTSGNNLLNSGQQQAFEDYIYGAGAFMGIHAATDTYRDQSWPFYNELVGAIVQSGPNHTPNGFNADMDVLLPTHPSVSHLGSTWNKDEEYYYWELNGGQLSTDNTNLLMVESTGSDSYDAPRPMAWFKNSIEVNGVTKVVRSFYTALGHNGSDYENNVLFQNHIKGAITWSICTGDKKTWDGTSWSPNGAPTSGDKVVIAGDYNTSINGAIDACTVIVESGKDLTVIGVNKVTSNKRIIVDGTMTIANTGEVQLNGE